MSILQEGDIVRDTYEVERLIGEGAFAEVYRVRHRYMGRREAMKVFKTPGASMEDLMTAMAEAQILSQLRHPNIIEVYDANLFDVGPRRWGYFTMTYMPGGTLDRYWRSFGADLMPITQVVDIVKQVCSGLVVAHSAKDRPIVHRDIKPQNILVCLSGGLDVRLSDFGLAKAVNPMTLLVSSQGTLEFKPPEAFRNHDSCAADIWAVGTTMYLLLTDQMPFPALEHRDVEDARRFLAPLPRPSTYNLDVDSVLERILFRCLAADPNDRYPNAMELLADLGRWVPKSLGCGKSLSEFVSGKPVLAGRSNHDLKAEAATAVTTAFEMAESSKQLQVAADLLEEALSKDPNLRDRYAGLLANWRKGIMHVSTRRFPPRESGTDAGKR